MNIIDGVVQGVPFRQAEHAGDEIAPSIVIIHDTASSLTPGNAAGYLRDNDAGVSVHFVIERNGEIEQQVRTDRRANHAGKSEYHGRKWCNGFSIGVELVNPGRMTKGRNGFAVAWFGKAFDIEASGIQEIETAAHGHGFWMPYTEPQIAALLRLLEALFRDVPSLRDITTHWYVSPGRKVDTNPLFPLENIRSVILGRDDPLDIEAEERSEPVSDAALVQINVPGGALNMRRWPSFNPNVIATIAHDTVVPVLRAGKFGGRDWLCVQFNGSEGWIVAAYADPVTFKEVGV